MKIRRCTHALFGVAAAAIACGIVWAFYGSVMNQRETSRIKAVQTLLEQKLAAYQRAKGEYPASLQLLAFTNSNEARMLSDIRKINYRTIRFGYELSYEGASGYTNQRTFTYQRVPSH